MPTKVLGRKRDATTTTTPLPRATFRMGSYGNSSIDQWDEAFVKAAQAVKQKRGVWVDPRVLKAMMDVESGGNGNYPPNRCRPSDGYDHVPACGPMQVKWVGSPGTELEFAL